MSNSAGPGSVVVFNAAAKLVRELDVHGSSNLDLGNPPVLAEPIS